MTKPYLSVILPCRNQADHIGEVLQHWVESLNTIERPYELVVIPNACTDSTPEIARDLAGRYPQFRVIENSAPGWGRAVRTGLDAAFGENLCYSNSARTDPDQIPALLRLFEQYRPCIAKVKRQGRGVLSRAIASWLYNLEGRLLFGIKSGDVNGTPKIFARAVWEQLSVTAQDDLFDMELIARASQLGIPVIELPVSGFRRHGGRSSTTFASARAMYWGAFRLRRSLRKSTRE